ncbi:hypothetical protein [Aurantiacibacter spongiae]|uniref:Uncharacterized protein n=1 Tax=Aurantiacibacter spongiae TaxID=2488860 RepID=A0A3N5CQ27_9SPHN|nr:hypothetical protein [Aurantiacibacter spongiae]RPF71133.1 hypothetical protein EG799_05540 [Aurantiacibacter spongiae]
MFALFKRHWLRAQPLKWIGLFAFEFLVVLSGVLVAQSLQERFEQRREQERFAATRVVLDEQVEAAVTNFLSRALQARCVRANLATIRQAVSQGTAADLSAIVRHPPHSQSAINVWSGDTAREARRHLDPDEVRRYDFLASLSQDVIDLRRQEEEWWAAVLLASDGGAGLNEQERTEAMLAAYKLDHAYEGWDQAVPTLVGSLRVFGLEPDVDAIERSHQGDGVCAAEVRALLPRLRTYVEQVKAMPLP